MGRFGCTEQDAPIGNRLLSLARRIDFDPGRLSRAYQWSRRANPPERSHGFVEISANQGVAPAELSRMLKFKIGFSDLYVRAISALAVSPRHLSGPSAPIRAQKERGVVDNVEIPANQGVAPAEMSRMLTFEIGLADSRGAAISALAVSQGHLGCCGAPIRARKGSGFVEIPTNQGVAPAQNWLL